MVGSTEIGLKAITSIHQQLATTLEIKLEHQHNMTCQYLKFYLFRSFALPQSINATYLDTTPKRQPTSICSKGIKKASLNGVTWGVPAFPENVCRLRYDQLC